MVIRKCVGCGKFSDRNDMIKITHENVNGEVIINPGSKIFGRSVYLCYNKSCIETAFKKNKISKILKVSIPEDMKGTLLNEF